MFELLAFATLLGAMISGSGDPTSVLRNDLNELMNAIARRQIDLEAVSTRLVSVKVLLEEAEHNRNTARANFLRTHADELLVLLDVWKHEVAFHQLQADRVRAQIAAINAGQPVPATLDPRSKPLVSDLEALSARASDLAVQSEALFTQQPPPNQAQLRLGRRLTAELTDLNLRQLDLTKQILAIEGVAPLPLLAPRKIEFSSVG